MTKMVYTVINRPKNDEVGQTNIGWKADNVSEEVTYAGYLVTARYAKFEDRRYHAFMNKDSTTLDLGDDFTTRARAAFAIWRAYYSDVKSERHMAKTAEQEERDRRRQQREERKAFRDTPAGMEAYRKELNEKARVRRASMTPEEKAAIAERRREKRKLEKE